LQDTCSSNEAFLLNIKKFKDEFKWFNDAPSNQIKATKVKACALFANGEMSRIFQTLSLLAKQMFPI
jgi:hypothetical protein